MSPPTEASNTYRTMSPVVEATRAGNEHFEFDDSMDGQLKDAAEKAERENNMRPLLMYELKNKIQQGRLQQGKTELVILPEPPKVYPLTEEEKKRQEKRKYRNRNAAKNSRMKKKVQHDDLRKENEKLTSRKKYLRNVVKQLQETLHNMQQGVKSKRICDQAYGQVRHHSNLPQVIQRGPQGQIQITRCEKSPEQGQVTIRRQSQNQGHGRFDAQDLIEVIGGLQGQVKVVRVPRGQGQVVGRPQMLSLATSTATATPRFMQVEQDPGNCVDASLPCITGQEFYVSVSEESCEAYSSSPASSPLTSSPLASPQSYTSNQSFTSSPQSFTSSPQLFTSSPQAFVASPQYSMPQSYIPSPSPPQVCIPAQNLCPVLSPQDNGAMMTPAQSQPSDPSNDLTCFLSSEQFGQAFYDDFQGIQPVEEVVCASSPQNGNDEGYGNEGPFVPNIGKLGSGSGSPISPGNRRSPDGIFFQQEIGRFQ